MIRLALTYSSAFAFGTSDLVTLCEDCHDAIHNHGAVAPTAGQEASGAGLGARLYAIYRTYKRLRRLF